MEIVKKGIYKPKALTTNKAFANFVGHVFIPAKEYRAAIPAREGKKGTKTRPPVKPQKAVPEQKAQDAFYFDYYVNENLLFWANGGDVVFAIHRQGVNWIAPNSENRTWEMNGNFASGQDTKMTVQVPEGYDYHEIIDMVSKFYNT